MTDWGVWRAKHKRGTWTDSTPFRLDNLMTHSPERGRHGKDQATIETMPHMGHFKVALTSTIRGVDNLSLIHI